jgi:hypothetical protein
MKKTILKWCCLGMPFAIVFMACAGTKLSDTQVDKSRRGKPVSNILVIGVTYKDNEKVRRSFEDRFVKQLRAAGVEAVPSGDAISIPSDLMLEKEQILKAADQFNNDAVIITYVAAKEEKESYTKRYDNYYSYYGSVYVYTHGPGYSSTKTYHRLVTNLYDVKTEKLIWSGKSQTLNPDSTTQVIDEVIEVVIEDLQKNKLLPPKAFSAE